MGVPSVLQRTGPSEEQLAAFQKKLDAWRALHGALAAVRATYESKLRGLMAGAARLERELEDEAEGHQLFALLLAARRPDA